MQDLNEIAIFARVVKEESFTKAARTLGLPKSTVSERVSRLEERLGVRLLDRTTRHVRPTAAGAAYYERAARVVAEIEEANAAVTDIHRSPKGLLRIGSPLLFGHAFLGDFVAEFLVTHPEVEVELIVADRRFDVVEEGLDLAVHVIGPIEASLIARKIGSAERMCVASPTYLEQHEAPKMPKDLLKHSCLVSSNDRRATWVFSKEGRSESIVIQNDSSFRSGTAVLTLIVSRPSGPTWRVETISSPVSRRTRTVNVAVDAVGFATSTNVEYCCGPPMRASPVAQCSDGSITPWLPWLSESPAAPRSQYIDRSATTG